MRDTRLGRVERELDAIRKEIAKMANDILAAVRAAAARITGVEASVKAGFIALAKQLSDLVAASGNTVDPADVQAIADSINQNADRLTADILQGTPAAPGGAQSGSGTQGSTQGGVPADTSGLTAVVDANNNPVTDAVTGNPLLKDADGNRFTTDANGKVVAASS